MCVPSIYKVVPFLKKEGLPGVALLSTGGGRRALYIKEIYRREY